MVGDQCVEVWGEEGDVEIVGCVDVDCVGKCCIDIVDIGLGGQYFGFYVFGGMKKDFVFGGQFVVIGVMYQKMGL